jgi:hypothetical protein
MNLRRLNSFALVLVLVACSAPAAAPAPTPSPTDTPLPALTATPQSTERPLPTKTTAPTLTPTPTLASTSTPDPTAVAQIATLKAEIATTQAMLTATSDAINVTRQAQDDLLKQMRADGSITLKDVTSYPLADLDESWAQRNYLRWWPTGYKLSDFVIMTHIQWDSAQDFNASWEGGCGFVIRAKDQTNYLLLYLLIGGAYERLMVMTPKGVERFNPNWVLSGLAVSRKTQGEADFAIAAEKDKITTYTNGVKTYTWKVRQTDAGDIGYTIVSGTNTGFGTSCKMTHTRVWKLE